MKSRALIAAIALAVAPALFGSITGTVLHSDGTPAANIRVAAFRPLPSYLALIALASGKLEPLATSSTDDHGVFKLEVVGLGVVDIHIEAEGFAPADRQIATDEGAGVVALVAARTVAGKVTAEGKPVEGAVVMAFGAEGMPIVTSTDSKGIFRLPDPTSWAQSIIVKHSDFALAAHPPSSLEFALDRGREVRGKVVDVNGKPVASARVDVDRVLFATSADDGSFTVAHVPEQVASIRARAGTAAVTQPMSAGSPILKLNRAAHVAGVVRDAEKRPLTGISVLLTAGERFVDMAVTDIKGSFAFDGIPQGKYSLSAGGASVYTAESSEVDVTDRDARVDVVAQRERKIEGVVRKDDGSAVAAASIAVSYSNMGGRYAVGPVTMMTGEVTDTNGLFRIPLTDTEASSKLRVVAVTPGLPLAFSSEMSVEEATKRLIITIPKGVDVVGIVVGPEKKPLSGVDVDPVLAGEERFGLGREPAGSHRAWTTTGADGRFAGRLASGSAALAFAKKGYVRSQQSIDVRLGMKPIEVSLTESATIRGHVLRHDGKPATEIPVMVEDADTSNAAMSASDGSFSVEGLAAGVHNIRFGRTMSQQQTVRAPADDVRLVLQATRTIRGRVIDAASGAPLQQFTIAHASNENEWAPPQPFASASGEFSLEIPESTANITASAEGYVTAKAAALKDSEPLTLSLSQGRTIHGHVVDQQGAALAGVEIAGSTFDAGHSSESRSDGTFELRGVDFHELTIGFRKEGFVTATEKVRASRDDATVDVTMRHGISIVGRVIDPSGTGVGNMQVSATSAVFGAESASAATDAAGAFHFDSLAPGRYDFQVDRNEEGFSGRLRDIDVEKIHQVTIRLEKHAAAVVFGHVSGVEATARNRTVSVTDVEGESQMTPIDLEGNYRMTNAPVGLVQIQARFGDGSHSRSTKAVSLELSPNFESRVDLTVASQVSLRGHVLRADAPLPNVRINFSDGMSYVMATSGPDGAYDVAVDPGEYEISIFSPEGKQLPFREHIVVTNRAEIDFRIDSISQPVIVLDAQSGQPVDAAQVTAGRRGETHAFAETTTGQDGAASFDLSRGDAVTLRATKSGYANASADATAGESGTVALHLSRSPGAVVRIIDQRDGRTLNGYVIARDGSGSVVAATNQPEPDGSFILAVASGAYQFSASADEYGSQTVASEVPSTEIRIPLPRGGKLALTTKTVMRGTGRLIQPNGEQYVRCWCNGIAEIRIDGRMTLIDRVSPGSYVLEVTFTGEKPRRFPVTVIEGQTITVAID